MFHINSIACQRHKTSCLNLAAQDPSLVLMKRVAAATVTGCGGGIWVAICASIDDNGGGSSSTLTIFDSRTLRIIAHAPLTPPPHASSPPPMSSSLPFPSSSLSSSNASSLSAAAPYHAREWCVPPYRAPHHAACPDLTPCPLRISLCCMVAECPPCPVPTSAVANDGRQGGGEMQLVVASSASVCA
jgi:hypothetical protein